MKREDEQPSPLPFLPPLPPSPPSLPSLPPVPHLCLELLIQPIADFDIGVRATYISDAKAAGLEGGREGGREGGMKRASGGVEARKEKKERREGGREGGREAGRRTERTVSIRMPMGAGLRRRSKSMSSIMGMTNWAG